MQGATAPYPGDRWSVASLNALKERTAASGIGLDTIALPLSSCYIANAGNPDIKLGKSPERDSEIQRICQIHPSPYHGLK